MRNTCMVRVTFPDSLPNGPRVKGLTEVKGGRSAAPGIKKGMFLKVELRKDTTCQELLDLVNPRLKQHYTVADGVATITSWKLDGDMIEDLSTPVVQVPLDKDGELQVVGEVVTPECCSIM
mmetsp:Transcript_5186/g.11550  ORF Transcript_5186/g.11550 Transcript_5186/m.11550 type:complete len:121 (-) Transcript_5186:45-407(-)